MKLRLISDRYIECKLSASQSITAVVYCRVLPHEMIRSDKNKGWGSKITRPILRHSSGIWLMVLGILVKNISHTRCFSRDSNRIFPGYKSQNSPFEPTCCNIRLSVKGSSHADAFVPSKSAQASIGWVARWATWALGHDIVENSPYGCREYNFCPPPSRTSL